MKKRTYRDPAVDDHDRDKTADTIIKDANIIEQDIREWLQRLPEHYQLDTDPEINLITRLSEEVFEVAVKAAPEPDHGEDEHGDGDGDAEGPERKTGTSL